MILAIDAGNSRVKWGWHDGTAWSSIANVSLIEFAASSDHINPFSATHDNPARIIISNVAGEGAHQLLVNGTSIFDAEPLWLKGAAQTCGVRNGYERPEQLGPDRWAALIAARALEPERACLVVNAGTATTVDALSRAGEFLGGVIVPGVDLMRFVLHEHTGSLPLQPGKFVATPRNTVDAIESGCRQAQAGAVERMPRVPGGDSTCLVSGGRGPALLRRLQFPGRHWAKLGSPRLARLAGRRAAEQGRGGGLPPPRRGGGAAGRRNAAELKGRGIQHSFAPRQEGNRRGGVPRGVFAGEDAPKRRLESLRVKGVRSA